MTRSERVALERVVDILRGLLAEDPPAIAEAAETLAADLCAAEQNRRERRPELN
jgi:hypothetical protein